MKTLAAAALLVALSACNDSVNLDRARALIAEECGPAPTAPGYALGFERGAVLLSPADWQRIAEWRGSVEDYTACVQGFAVEP